MSKSIKLQDDTFIDSTGIVHNKTLLSEILESLDADALTQVVSGISNDINRADLNDFTSTFIAGYGHNLVNSPLEDTPQGHLISIPRHDAEGFVTQYFTPYPNGDLYTRQCQEGTWGAWTLVNPYKVGDVCVTSANANPSDRYGGTWELIDKEFKSANVTGAKGTEYTLNTTNCTEVTQFYWARSGHTITLSIRFTNKVQIADDALTMFTINYNALGISRIWYHYRGTFWSDLAKCLGFFSLNNTSGAFQTVDMIPDNYISAGRTDNSVSFSFNVPADYMLDEACDKFFWKKTA